MLWRTEKLLAGGEPLVFPDAYRKWIELVYQRDDWEEEPESIALAYDTFSALQCMREADARRLSMMTVCAFRDEDNRVTGLTRDDEMSLTVLPLLPGSRFFDGQEMKEFKEAEFQEQLNSQAIPAPASWQKWLADCKLENEGHLAGYRQLEMKSDGQGGWSSLDGKFRYSRDFGLERNKDEST